MLQEMREICGVPTSPVYGLHIDCWYMFLRGFFLACCSAGSLSASCLSIDFGSQRPLHWSTSGAWSADDQDLLVVDTYKNEIIGVSLVDGKTRRWTEVVEDLGLRDLQAWVQDPKQFRATTAGWLLFDKNQGAKLIQLDDSLERIGAPISVQQRTLKSSGGPPANIELNWIYDFAEMARGVFAFADIKRSSVSYESAFLYFNGAGEHRIFSSVANDHPVRGLYVRNIRFLAAIEDRGYFIDMAGESLGISTVSLSEPLPRSLPFFPEQFDGRLDLTNLAEYGPRKATEIYARQERQAMAVGLYAYSNYLYLLGKEAIDDNGDTAWWLVKLDPRDGEELGRARLPTTAGHLTVVPGKGFWAFVEKAPVEGVGRFHAPYMDIPAIKLVATAWLENPVNSPLVASAPQVVCEPVRREIVEELHGKQRLQAIESVISWVETLFAALP